MKIEAKNAPQFVRHLGVIAKLAGVDYPYPFDIYAKLSRLEARANRICTHECNGTIDPDKAEKQLDKILEKVKELLPNAKTLFINGDPRGYTLKLKEEEARELGIYQDWGGYGIIAPSF